MFPHDLIKSDPKKLHEIRGRIDQCPAPRFDPWWEKFIFFKPDVRHGHRVWLLIVKLLKGE
jgi:hypothetical protein